MKDKLHRLRKVCRYASNVLTAGYIVLAVLAIAMAVMGIWMAFDDNVVNTFCDLTGISDRDTVTLAAACLESIVVFGVGSATVFITEKIVKSIYSEHSPFTAENADRMMVLCYMFLVTSVVMLVLEYLARKNVATTIIIFMGLLFVTVVIYALKLVFQYGAALQEESDQTL